MKKKTLIVIISMLLLVIIGVWAVPVFADEASNPPPTTQAVREAPRMRLLARLLLIQDETKIDAIIAKAEEAGKLNDEQAIKLKGFWTDHHEQFAKKALLTRLIWANDGAKVQAAVDKAVAAGKITQTQADNIMTLWTKLHST